MSKLSLDQDVLRKIRTRTRRRFAFTTIACLFYSGYLLGYVGLKDLFAQTISPGSYVTVSILFFCFLIVFFIALEFLYLRISIAEGKEK